MVLEVFEEIQGGLCGLLVRDNHGILWFVDQLRAVEDRPVVFRFAPFLFFADASLLLKEGLQGASNLVKRFSRDLDVEGLVGFFDIFSAGFDCLLKELLFFYIFF